MMKFAIEEDYINYCLTYYQVCIMKCFEALLKREIDLSSLLCAEESGSGK
jgi:hypothetical protein